MKLRIHNWLALAATLFGTGLLTSCGDDRFPDYSYKMTVYAGGKAFSTVRAMKQEQVFSAADSSGQAVKRELEGEAVILDLPSGQTVYALLSKPDEAEYDQKVAGYALLPLVPKFKRDPRTDDLAVERGTESLDRMADAQQAMVAIKGPQDLPRTRTSPDPYRGPRSLNNWPMFVTFDDPKDPKMVREVQSGEIGVSRITIEITDEPVTSGIGERLVWLPNYYDQMLNGSRIHNSNDLNNTLSAGDFISEISK